MKKTVILIIISAAVLFGGCGGAYSTRIEDHTMKMSSVLYREDDQLSVIAVGEYDTAYPEVKVVDMSLSASGGKITISDNTDGRIYEGAYTIKSKKLQTTIYDLTFDGVSGYAVVTVTKYADGGKTPTLIAEIDGYSLYFYPET